MSQRATCYSCESVALCWQTVAHCCTFLTVTVSLKVWQRETHGWLMWQQAHIGLWPCVNLDPCGLLPPHLSLRLQRSVSNWPTSEPADGTSSELLQSMSTGPAASLLPANTSAPPEVCVCMHLRMCVWPCFVTKFLFDTDCPPFVMVKTLEQVEPLGKSFKTWFDFLSDYSNQEYVANIQPSFLYHWIKEIVFFVVKKTFIHPNFTPFISLEG